MSTLSTRGMFRPTEAPLGNPWEAWHLGWMAAEFWMNSACDLMSHNHWLTPAAPPQAAAQRVLQRRWSRKALEGLEVAMEVQRASYELWFGQMNPWYHRREGPPPAPPCPARAAPRLGRRLSSVK